MLKYVLFQHLTRILLQYICNANEIQNKVQERSDGALDADEGQGHEQCCRYGCDGQQPWVTLGTAIRLPVTVKSRMV